ncbi:hypothetical protein T484DRAFT_1777059, partial [Baffinella frigidus]
MNKCAKRGLFAARPVLAVEGSLGVLHFHLSPLVFGRSEFRITLVDSGLDATPAGDRRRSEEHVVLFEVLATNSAPVFMIPGRLEAVQASGAKVIDNFATNISTGGPEEAAQTYTFSLAGVSRVA